MTEELARGAAELWDLAPVGWVTTTPDWEIVTANATLLDWCGRDHDDLVGRHFSELLTPAGRIFHETHHAPLVRHRGRASEIAAELVAEPEPLPVLLESRAGTLTDGREVVQTCVVKVAERRRYERELLEQRRRAEASEERMRVVHEATAHLLPVDGVTDLAARLCEAIVDVAGVTHPSVWLVDDSGDGLVELGDAPRTARRLPLRAEHPAAVAARRREVVVDDRVGMVAVPLGRRGELGVLCLVTPDGLGEEPLEVLTTLAGIAGGALDRARLQQRRDEFIRTAARDLRAPLATILGHVATLQAKLEEQLEEAEERTLARVMDTAERLHELVDGFLELTRIEAGLGSPERREVVLADVVRDAALDVRGLLDQRRVVVDVADHTGAATLAVDPEQIRRAVGHLLVDAAHHSPAGGRVTVSVQQTAETLDVVLRDDGVGEEGQWVQSTTSSDVGTLGLAIARGFVGAHGGSIVVEQTLGGGWTSLHLPRS